MRTFRKDLAILATVAGLWSGGCFAVGYFTGEHHDNRVRPSHIAATRLPAEQVVRFIDQVKAEAALP